MSHNASCGLGQHSVESKAQSPKGHPGPRMFPSNVQNCLVATCTRVSTGRRCQPYLVDPGPTGPTSGAFEVVADPGFCKYSFFAAADDLRILGSDSSNVLPLCHICRPVQLTGKYAFGRFVEGGNTVNNTFTASLQKCYMTCQAGFAAAGEDYFAWLSSSCMSCLGGNSKYQMWENSSWICICCTRRYKTCAPLPCSCKRLGPRDSLGYTQNDDTLQNNMLYATLDNPQYFPFAGHRRGRPGMCGAEETMA